MQKSLFMILLGCRPPRRNTEQHDIFFGIAESLRDLIPAIKKSWPETKGNIHIDAWRKVTCVDGYAISVTEIMPDNTASERGNELFFINLGGYKENEFDEFHYKILVVADSLEAAKQEAKKCAFFKHASLEISENNPDAISHIDDKFGIDIDDFYKLEDILPSVFKEKYQVMISASNNCAVADELHLGYVRLMDL